MTMNNGPDRGPQDAPRPQPLPTRSDPAHAATDSSRRVRLLLYALTAVLLIIAGIVWLVGRDDSTTTIDVLADPEQVDTAAATDDDDSATDEASEDAGASDTEETTVAGDADDGDTEDDEAADTTAADAEGETEAVDDTASDDAADDEASQDDGSEGDDTAADDDEASQDDGSEGDDAAADGDEAAGPVRADPDAVVPADAPPDVAASLDAIAAGEVPESRGIVKGGRIFLVGAVPSQEEADAIVETAGAVLGADNVFNYYVIDDRSSDAGTGNVRVDDQVLFQTGSADIAPEFEPLLGQALVLMQIRPAVTLTVVGHTDSVGPEDFNQQLSEDRAQSVANWLVERGIDAARLTVEGRGESEPIATNDTEEGRLANRRIQVFIENLLG